MQCYKLRGVALELTGINDFQNSINENEWDEDWGVIWHCHLTLLSILYLVTSLFITILFNKPWIFTWIKFFRSIALAQGWWMSMNINYVKSVNFASYNVRCTVIFFSSFWKLHPVSLKDEKRPQIGSHLVSCFSLIVLWTKPKRYAIEYSIEKDL